MTKPFILVLPAGLPTQSVNKMLLGDFQCAFSLENVKTTSEPEKTVSARSNKLNEEQLQRGALRAGFALGFSSQATDSLLVPGCCS